MPADVNPEPSDIVLRDKLLPSDRAWLESILLASRFFREDEVTVALELMDDNMTKGEDSEYHFIVASRGQEAVGYCCYGRIACTMHSYDLYWIAVTPSLQGGGIGRRLMAAAEERAKADGGKRMYVETSSRSQYEPTRQFYISCGYRVEATLDDFYADGDGKVILVKPLA